MELQSRDRFFSIWSIYDTARREVQHTNISNDPVEIPRNFNFHMRIYKKIQKTTTIHNKREPNVRCNICPYIKKQKQKQNKKRKETRPYSM
jgi:hypothetical protein